MLSDIRSAVKTFLSLADLSLFPSSDVDVDKPDEKSIMTYVAQFLKHYPDPHQTETDGQPEEVPSIPLVLLAPATCLSHHTPPAKNTSVVCQYCVTQHGVHDADNMLLQPISVC